MKYSVQTEFPIAFDSRDHTQPGGTKNDSSRNPKFNEKLFALLKDKPNFSVVDLGCAGGGFVKDMIDAGHDAIGIEGSDYSLLRKRAEWATIPDSLFTADITRPFTVKQRLQSVNPDAHSDWSEAQFDVVTAWEVMEHLPADRLPTLCDNIKRIMKPNAVWIMSVSTQHGDHHVTVKNRKWWIEMFKGQGLKHDPAAVEYFGDDWVRGPNQGAPESFHLILSKDE